MQEPRLVLLDLGELRCVLAELQDSAGLHAAGELGVDRFVDERPAVALDVGDALQEVGVSAPRQRPGLVEERGLEDDVGTVGDGLAGQVGGESYLVDPAGLRDLDDPTILGAQRVEVALLVLVPAPAHRRRARPRRRSVRAAVDGRSRSPSACAIESPLRCSHSRYPTRSDALTTQRPSARYIARRSRNRRRSHATSCSEGVRGPVRVGGTHRRPR